ncbi:MULTISPECIES: IclR family transcriptional regulator [unclassified Pseudofrankia]|uniref:IclR family transcriptional regulator n=1 Tax=unclassified Pseudofrankia TaxID=2994372 RepID=UPI0008D93CCB|nr:MULTISPECIES: helix-turn-helix domain-containing protein [unclassified Pseudofrankia]MDT3439202.1 helix-turn-helix domain-containing protein [Pseudofrankia sp. BMG5.37]OHV43835.1 IclR family transcriptional regulator [Pseudofrankia sp. BMG5.36]
MPRPAPGVERTVALITFLSAHPDQLFGLSDLARRLDLNKATAHAMLAALTDAGWLARDVVDKTYRLGPALIAVGDAAGGPERRALELARPHMRRLRDELGVQVVASTAHGDDIVILAVESHADAPAGLGSRPGSRVPLSPPLGTVFVAWSETATVESWLRRLNTRLDDHRLGAYRDVIKTIRRRGYTVALEDDRRDGLSTALHTLADNDGDAEVRAAVERVLQAMSTRDDYLLADLDGIESHQLSMISAPIFDTAGRVCLALTLSGFPRNLRSQEVEPYGQRLTDVTSKITKRSGGRAPDESFS